MRSNFEHKIHKKKFFPPKQCSQPHEKTHTQAYNTQRTVGTNRQAQGLFLGRAQLQDSLA